MDHPAIPVTDQERSLGFYERYSGFGARAPRRYPDGVELVEGWDELEYVSVKCRDPTATSSKLPGSPRPGPTPFAGSGDRG